jgi:hypothetical protein
MIRSRISLNGSRFANPVRLAVTCSAFANRVS